MDFFYDEIDANNTKDKKGLKGFIENDYFSDPYNSQYIYGKLNKEVTPAYYTGKSTKTAITTVDNGKMEISVDINESGVVTPEKLDEQLTETENNLKNYVDEYGGKIDTITFNDILQPIDKNKNVNLNESDPIFRKSVAFNITNQDIENWNNKLDKDAVDLTNYYDKNAIDKLLITKQDKLKSSEHIIIEDNVIKSVGLASEEDVNNKLSNYEKLENKTNILNSESTEEQYPNAKVVYQKLEDVTAIALGRNTSYVVSAKTQPKFNTQSKTISINTPITDVSGNIIQLRDIRVGDTFYVIEEKVPDRWVETKTTEGTVITITLNILESSELPVTDVQINGQSIVEEKIAKIPIAGANLGVVRLNNDLGVGINESGELQVLKADNLEIDDRINNNKVITPSNLDYAVKQSLTNNKGLEYTEEEKTNARTLIGAISRDVDDLTNYQDKTTTNNLISSKQDKLTAGNRIEIKDNMIGVIDESLENLVLNKDLDVYANVGNITSASPKNPVRVANVGDTFDDLWEELFGQKDTQPTITSQPSISFTIGGYGPNAQEYGTRITSIILSITKNTGSYTYDGTNTGVTWGDNTYKINTVKTTPSSGTTLPIEYEVGVTSAIDVMVLSTNSEGNIAKTLLGKDSNPIVRIESGEKVATKQFSITSVKYSYYGVTTTTNSPIDSTGKCTLTKRTSQSGTSGTYTFSPQGQYIWLITPTQINKITWNGNLLSEGANQDYTYKGIIRLTLDSGKENVNYYAYMMNGSKTGTFTYVVS